MRSRSNFRTPWFGLALPPARKAQVVVVLVWGMLAQDALAQDVKPTRWESHFRLGSQTYMNELTPDPGSAGLFGLAVLYALSPRSFVGGGWRSAAYEITYEEARPGRIGKTESEATSSLLAFYHFRFRPGQKFRPYLEAGLGGSDPIIGYDEGMKFAVGLSLGLLWKLANKWALTIETRGLSWSQDDTADVIEALSLAIDDVRMETETVSVGANQFTLGAVYLW